MIHLRISEAAALAIIEQADYYRAVSDETLASNWEAAVNDAIRSLLKWPERGTPCRFRSPALAGIRWILIPGFPKHLLFYRHSSNQQSLLIMHVLHGSRDLESILNEEL